MINETQWRFQGPDTAEWTQPPPSPKVPGQGAPRLPARGQGAPRLPAAALPARERGGEPHAGPAASRHCQAVICFRFFVAKNSVKEPWMGSAKSGSLSCFYSLLTQRFTLSGVSRLCSV